MQREHPEGAAPQGPGAVLPPPSRAPLRAQALSPAALSPHGCLLTVALLYCFVLYWL